MREKRLESIYGYKTHYLLQEDIEFYHNRDIILCPGADKSSNRSKKKIQRVVNTGEDFNRNSVALPENRLIHGFRSIFLTNRINANLHWQRRFLNRLGSIDFQVTELNRNFWYFNSRLRNVNLFAGIGFFTTLVLDYIWTEFELAELTHRIESRPFRTFIRTLVFGTVRAFNGLFGSTRFGRYSWMLFLIAGTMFFTGRYIYAVNRVIAADEVEEAAHLENQELVNDYIEEVRVVNDTMLPRIEAGVRALHEGNLRAIVDEDVAVPNIFLQNDGTHNYTTLINQILPRFLAENPDLVSNYNELTAVEKAIVYKTFLRWLHTVFNTNLQANCNSVINSYDKREDPDDKDPLDYQKIFTQIKDNPFIVNREQPQVAVSNNFTTSTRYSSIKDNIKLTDHFHDIKLKEYGKYEEYGKNPLRNSVKEIQEMNREMGKVLKMTKKYEIKQSKSMIVENMQTEEMEVIENEVLMVEEDVINMDELEMDLVRIEEYDIMFAEMSEEYGYDILEGTGICD